MILVASCMVNEFGKGLFAAYAHHFCVPYHQEDAVWPDFHNDKIESVLASYAASWRKALRHDQIFYVMTSVYFLWRIRCRSQFPTPAVSFPTLEKTEMFMLSSRSEHSDSYSSQGNDSQQWLFVNKHRNWRSKKKWTFLITQFWVIDPDDNTKYQNVEKLWWTSSLLYKTKK